MAAVSLIESLTVLSVAVTSSIEALVSSQEAAFSSEIAERVSTSSTTIVLALSTSITDLSISEIILEVFSTCLATLLNASSTFLRLTLSSVVTLLTFSASSVLLFVILIIFSTIDLIFFEEVADCVARLPISDATTAKPLPASPALAASILALSERRLVCEAISSIRIAAFSTSVAASCDCLIPATIFSTICF